MEYRVLLERLDQIERRTFAGTVLRHHGPSHTALSGDGARRAGGRWNPPDSFPTLYCGLDLATVDREFARSLRRAGLPLKRPRARRLARITVRLSRVLDLTDDRVLASLDLNPSELLGDDLATSQQLGAAAHHLGYEAVLAPSATGSGAVLALFLDTRAADSIVEVESVNEEYTPATD